MNGIIAFLDLLGFSYFCRADFASAANLLLSYQLIVKTKLQDFESHPPDSYPNDELKERAESNLMNSFNIFIPCSDSIFITATDADLFLRQLSNFLVSCFLLPSELWRDAPDPASPYNTEFPVFKLKPKDGKMKAHVEQDHMNVFPILFRGGVTFGDFDTFRQNAVVNSEIGVVTNILGNGVVNAVKLESSGLKGPRIICDGTFADLLDDEHKKYVSPVNSGELYEILWPAYWLVEDNDVSNVNELFRLAIHFYNGLKDTPVGDHYKEMLKLFVKSARLFAQVRGVPNIDRTIDDLLASADITLDDNGWKFEAC